MKDKIKYLVLLSTFTGLTLNLLDVILSDYESKFNSLFLTLSYFTVQSNIIVFTYFLLMVLPSFKKGKTYEEFFGGVFSYILVTGFIFATVLERLYDPTGLLLGASIFNHYVTPLLVISYYLLNKAKYKFTYKHVQLWMLYPLEYAVFVIGIGIVTGSFLYPFLEVNEIGIFFTSLSILLLAGMFIAIQLAIVKISKMKQ